MAYPTRDRDPLLGGDLQALIERRGKEVIGGIVAFAGLLAWVMLATHSPEDPNWLNATDAPVRNWLGPLGASLSHPMFMVVGKAAWIVPLGMVAWGLRFVFHRGDDRAMARATFIPVAIVVTSLFLATLAPEGQGSYNYRAGGMLGYTVLSMLLTVAPIGNSFATGLLSGLLFVGGAGMTLYALGVTLREVRTLGAAVFGGSLAGALAGASFLKGAADRGAALSRSASALSRGASAGMAQHLAGRLESRQAARSQTYNDDQGFDDFVVEDDDLGYDVPVYDTPAYDPAEAQRPRGNMFARDAARDGARAAVNAPPLDDFTPEVAHRKAAVIRPAAGASIPPAPPALDAVQDAPMPPRARLDEDDMPRPFGDGPAPYPPAWDEVASHIHRFDDVTEPPAREPAGFLSRASGIFRRAAGIEPAREFPRNDLPTPELVARQPRTDAVGMPDGDRIRSKISEAIAARKDDEGVINPLVAPQPVPRPRRAALPDTGLRVEPPLTATMAPLVAQMAAPLVPPVASYAAPAAVHHDMGHDGEGWAVLPPKPARPAHFHTPTAPQVHAAPVQADGVTGHHVLPPMPHRPVAPAAVRAEQAGRVLPPVPPRPTMPSAPAGMVPHMPAPSVRAPAVDAPATSHTHIEEARFDAPRFDAPRFETPRPPSPTAGQGIDFTQNSPLVAANTAEEPPLNIFDPDMADLGEDLLLDAGQSWESTGTAQIHPQARVTRAVGMGALERSGQAAGRAQIEKSRFADYELPPIALLSDPSEIERHDLSDDQLEENARLLETVLEDYGIKGEIVSVRPGPVVTMYELEPAPGLKASRVIGLADDIARSMSALSARVSTVPGRTVIGIELPNARREKVVLREILEASEYGNEQMRLPLALGKDIGGEAIVANLAKMPHLLIAGTTGSGKSVAINTMILSLLYKLSPDECRLIMIDPKMLELSVYDGIPHLLSPVVTDPKKAVVALKWVVAEMEERYRKMSRMGVRNIEGYNGRVRDALSRGEMFSRTVQTGFDEETGDPIFETEETQPQLLPFIVVIVDEMADLMMVAGKEIEACIQRLAQMARASGIHLIMATQRPSVDVITGTIKANFPTRISFQVTSKIDSRTILGEQGAEQLLGMGDMLYMAGGGRVTRVHGPFVSDEEVEEIVNYLKTYGPPDYQSGVVEGPDDDTESDIDAVLGLNTGGNSTGDDALYDQAVAIVARDRKCSTSYIQRKLGIGYNKAARLVEQMEEQGVVTPANHVGKRDILLPEP
ncbi:DNA translocase FtsK [Ketogulonicigenium robustum]|uniref:DNA translocase FtsK n=1 Tax=Ketogulonicigenium robustum TaxID=92947 RepID=A0A1W6P2W3_9RHOB|nr:DNA translocase FtsK [Ketogulonicigenium robustum]ARO15731.1 DNA translocase FtsK [Ketogulonicigenium robustum]